jgi:hypothetical protein
VRPLDVAQVPVLERGVHAAGDVPERLLDLGAPAQPGPPSEALADQERRGAAALAGPGQ